MNIILFPRSKGRAYSLQCNRWYHVGAFSLLLVIGVVSLIAVGYYFGNRIRQSPVDETEWRQNLFKQEQQIRTTQELVNAHVDALVRRLALLQAHVNRLDALGNTLVAMAKLDEGEFDFSTDPGIGGPEQLDGCYPNTATDISQVLDDLMEQLDDREAQLKVLDHIIMSRNLSNEIHPAGRPIKKGWMSSYYGKRKDPFTGKTEFHKGIDFAGKMGSDIIAVAGGVVTGAGKRYGYGQLVEIDHGRNYVTRYGHNKKILVKVGDTVKKGQVIAKMGSTGRSTGPHVHFEVVKNGKHLNPAKFISAAK
jgi:murein DD-endopeptidase MepM/ murein hydrolase activator NlpD